MKGFIKLLFILFVLTSCELDHDEAMRDNESENGSQASEKFSDPQRHEILKKYSTIGLMLDSLAMYESQKNHPAIAKIKIQLADRLRSSGNYYDAIRFLEDARTKLRTKSNEKLNSQLFNVLAAVYYELYIHNRIYKTYLDSADTYARKAVIAANKVKDVKLKTTAFIIIGGVHIHQNDYEKAVLILERAQKLHKKTSEFPELSILANLSYAHLKLGDLDTALVYSQRCLEEATKSGDIVFSVISQKNLVKIYNAFGNKAKMNELRKNIDKLASQKDVIVKSLINKQLLINYEKQKAESKILGLYKDKYYLFRLSRILLAGLVVTILIAATVTYLIISNYQKKKKVTQQHLQIEKKEKEYHLAKSRILDQDKKLEKEKTSRYKLELQVKEQELVYQSLKQAKLAKINQSIKDKLLPYSIKLPRKTDQKEFQEKINTICREAGRDSLADFEKMFVQMHGRYYEKLTTINTELTRSELQLCALLRMNLPTKEIAHMLSLSPYTIDQRRHSIRIKLHLENNMNLNSYLISL
ncbi:MAG: hypothetical protein K9J27_05030 [Bacteroidales bacterium]|nr:hypothetical protein [Bacteroidales bacterium]MCF8333069.1 hypothetical protein [Bacteroidales bacterium]